MSQHNRSGVVSGLVVSGLAGVVAVGLIIVVACTTADAWIASLQSVSVGQLSSPFFQASTFVPWVHVLLFTCSLPLWCDGMLFIRIAVTVANWIAVTLLGQVIIAHRFTLIEVEFQRGWWVTLVGVIWFGLLAVWLIERVFAVRLQVGSDSTPIRAAPSRIGIRSILSITTIIAVGLAIMRASGQDTATLLSTMATIASGVALQSMRTLSLSETVRHRWIGRALGGVMGIAFSVWMLFLVEAVPWHDSANWLATLLHVASLIAAATLATVVYWFASMVPILWLQACQWRLVMAPPYDPR